MSDDAAALIFGAVCILCITAVVLALLFYGVIGDPLITYQVEIVAKNQAGDKLVDLGNYFVRCDTK